MNRIRLIDWLSSKHVWRYYRQYVETQWYARRELDVLRVAKLRRLLEHCERHVPFYQALMRERGIVPARVDSLDVLQDFPVIDKAVAKRHHPEFVATNAHALGKVRSFQTGGTTGEPLRFLKDAAVRSSSQAAMFRFFDWMGVGLGDPKVVLWGKPIVRPPWSKRIRDAILRRVMNTRQVDPFGMSRAGAIRLAELFRRFRPVMVHGYCQSIYELARWFAESGDRFSLRAVSTTVEPLFDEYRVVFREVFGCDTFDQYGCGEVEAIAMECPRHHGLHVTEERVVLELDGDRNVIVTDLDNLAFPFIRYRNGDQAIAAPQPCDCGRATMMLERILGRTGDVIGGPTGSRVHPEFFTHLLNETGISLRTGLRKYQVVQERPDRLVWKVAAAPLSEGDRDWLIDRVRAYLGDVEVQIDEVDDIPPARSGKFQYVISRH